MEAVLPKTPPASAVWRLNFDLTQYVNGWLVDTTRFSGVECSTLA